MPSLIPASIEVSPKQAVESNVLPGLFPVGTSVYMTDIGTDPNARLVAGAKRLRELGYEPVPHFAARRMPSRAILKDRIERMVGEADVRDVLVIGGGLEKEVGEFDASMALLETGLFEANGIRRVAIAGHPEGSPDFSDAVALETLHAKQAFAKTSGLDLRIVTQFGFDGAGFVAWAEGLRREGITLPIHLGVAGPAKITTLMRFAMMCGVGNSLSFLKKRAGSIKTMALGFDPDEIVQPIETHWQVSGESALGSGRAVAQIHVFPFGGLKTSTRWLRERGTWPVAGSADLTDLTGAQGLASAQAATH